MKGIKYKTGKNSLASVLCDIHGKKTWVPRKRKLSEAYDMTEPGIAPLEVSVRVICEEELQNTQNTLGSYYNFIGFVKDNIVNEKSVLMQLSAISTIFWIESISEFLKQLSAEEVANMTNFEFNLEQPIYAAQIHNQ